MLSAKGNASFFGFGPKGAASFDFSGHERKKCFLNDHGKGVVDVSYLAGIDSAQDGRAVAVADLDHSGNPSLLMAMRDHPLFHVWSRSANEKQSHRIALDVRSLHSQNRDAVGAEVRAVCGGKTITRLVAVGNGFASQNAHTLLIGMGECEKIDKLTVRWPWPLVEKNFMNVQADQFYTVDEDKLHPVPGHFAVKQAAQAVTVTAKPADLSLAKAVAGATAHDAAGKSYPWAAAHDLVYVDFWASWCEACKRNQPVVNALAEHFAGRMDFVGISMDPADGEALIAEHAKAASYPLLASPALIEAATPILGEKPPLPETLIFSRGSGKVVWKGMGVPSVSEVEQAIE